jgi:two-component system NtrC family sensor kinase
MPDTPNLIKESYEGALRVKKIIQDLRAFSHPQEGKLEEICIAEVVDTTLNIVWNELKYKADIVKEYLQAPTVRCYPQQVSQVLINLLINAVQAIETKGTITIRIYTRDDHAFVEVQDTGCGMSEEIQRHLFEPFFTTKEVGKGIGLGLSISYGIVKKHNGDITVKSQVGQGTTMTVRLPIEGPETPPQDSHQA